MNLIDLQILFQRKIEDVNSMFGEEQRPDTYTISNYLNKSIKQYINQKYLALPTFEQRIVSADINHDELSLLFRKASLTSAALTMTDFNWGTRGVRHRLPDDISFPLSLACTTTRTGVYPHTAQQVFAKFVSRRQAEKLVSQPNNRVMFPDPIAILLDKYYVVIIGDAYTTSITLPILTYVKKPFDLGYEYSEYESSNATITIGAGGNFPIATGVYFIAHSRIQYVLNGNPQIYEAGSKILKEAGYDTITKIDQNIKVGKPYGFTNVPEFPEYMHEGIVERAVALFLDEAKLKLIPKEGARQA